MDPKSGDAPGRGAKPGGQQHALRGAVFKGGGNLLIKYMDTS